MRRTASEMLTELEERVALIERESAFGKNEKKEIHNKQYYRGGPDDPDYRTWNNPKGKTSLNPRDKKWDSLRGRWVKKAHTASSKSKELNNTIKDLETILDCIDRLQDSEGSLIGTISKLPHNEREATFQLLAQLFGQSDNIIRMTASLRGLSRNLGRTASFNDRVAAGKPYLMSEGLTKAKVREGEAAMLYMIDEGRNQSKYYELLIVQSPQNIGGYTLIKRWGRLGPRFSREKSISVT